MSTATAPLPSAKTTGSTRSDNVSFGGVVLSEWVKLTTLRSTLWSYVILIALQVAFGLMLVLSAGGAEGAPEGIGAGSTASSAATLGVLFNQLVISVLGVLVISGEYTTGQIRSTLVAVPKRLPTLWAKAIVFAATSFVVGLIAVFLAYAVTWPVLASQGISSDLSDVDVWGKLVAAAGYLALVGLIAFFIGALLRHSAAGIAAAVGLLLVVPPLLTFVGTPWSAVIGQWMPASAGQSMFFGGGVFEPWQALLVLLGWIIALALPAALLLKRRDA